MRYRMPTTPSTRHTVRTAKDLLGTTNSLIGTKTTPAAKASGGKNSDNTLIEKAKVKLNTALA
jgi:hypothetical protein